jgi:hypothetical protein
LEVVMGGKTLMRGAASLPAAQDTSLFIIPLFQITVPEAGDLEVFFTAGGYARTCALKKSISVGPVPGFISPNA